MSSFDTKYKVSWVKEALLNLDKGRTYVKEYIWTFSVIYAF